MVFDAHCDTLSKLVYENISFKDTNLHLNKHNINPGAVCFACFVNPDFRDGFSECIKMIRRFCSENFYLAVNYETMMEIINEGNTAAFLSVEGAGFLENTSDLQMLYRLGVRFINLTWNYDNNLAGGVMENKYGLTNLGRKMIVEMNNLGIILDVSHLGDKSFWDVAKATNKPFIAGHSNSRTCCNHVRNLTNDQFIEIKDRKGMVGINFYPDFLSDRKNATIKDVILHIEHFLSLGGEDCIGIGSDFDGIEKTPEKLENASKIGVLKEELLKLNYSDELTDKILYKNFMIFVKNNL